MNIFGEGIKGDLGKCNNVIRKLKGKTKSTNKEKKMKENGKRVSRWKEHFQQSRIKKVQNY